MQQKGRVSLNVVGSSAISTVQFGSWINQSAPKVITKGRKLKGVKEIINPIFCECAKLTDDQFWVEKLNDASIGKFPGKFSFRDNVLTYRKGARSASMEVPIYPSVAVGACIDFFRENGKLFSTKDSAAYHDIYQNQEDEEEEQFTWGDANKKVQDNLLSYFFDSVRKMHRLSDESLIQLRQVVNTGISGKYFSKDTIHVLDNRIAGIDGLIWNENARTFSIDPRLTPSATRSYVKKKAQTTEPSQKDTVPPFNAKWTKYVDTMDKKLTEYIRFQRKVTITQTVQPKTITLNIISPHSGYSTPFPNSPNSPTSASTTEDMEEDDDNTEDTEDEELDSEIGTND